MHSTRALGSLHSSFRSDADARGKAIPETRSSSELETTPRGQRTHTPCGAPRRARRPRADRAAGEVRGAGTIALRSICRDLAGHAASEREREAAAEESGHRHPRDRCACAAASVRNWIGSRRCDGRFSEEAAIARLPDAGTNANATALDRNDRRSSRLAVVCCFSGGVRVSGVWRVRRAAEPADDELDRSRNRFVDHPNGRLTLRKGLREPQPRGRSCRGHPRGSARPARDDRVRCGVVRACGAGHGDAPDLA